MSDQIPDELMELTVTLPAEQWKLIVFLTKRGIVHELNSHVLEHMHEPECLTGFTEAYKALHGSLRLQVTEPVNK
jgi:predicted SAM-dependent methyltransferase